MDTIDQYIINKFIESFIFVSYLFFTFISIQIFLLWKDVDKNIKELIVTDSFVQKNCLYALFLSLIVIIFSFFKNILQFESYFGIIKIMAPIILIAFSYEWYIRLKPRVSKLLPIELTDFNSILKND
jgi:hypothetical protein